MGEKAIRNLCLASSTELTLSDRRLYNYLLHNAFKLLPKQLDFTISLAQLEGVYGITLPPVDKLKESLRKLFRTLIEFETSEGEWLITSFLEKAEFDKSKSQLHYSFSVVCRRLFTNPFF